MGATTILLARHGETDWNRANRFQGHADEPLNETGREQARSLAAELRADRITAAYSSPLTRALETATIVADLHDLEVRVDRRLMEVDTGSWSGLTRDEIEQQYPGDFARWRAGEPGWRDGETYAELAERVLEGLREIAGAHPGETVLVVGHGGTIRVTLAHADGLELTAHRKAFRPAGNCAVFRLVAQDGTLTRVE